MALKKAVFTLSRKEPSVMLRNSFVSKTILTSTQGKNLRESFTLNLNLGKFTVCFLNLRGNSGGKNVHCSAIKLETTFCVNSLD